MALAYFQETLDLWKYNLWKEDEKRGTLDKLLKGQTEKKSPWRVQSINLEPGIFIESYNAVVL